MASELPRTRRVDWEYTVHRRWSVKKLEKFAYPARQIGQSPVPRLIDEPNRLITGLERKRVAVLCPDRHADDDNSNVRGTGLLGDLTGIVLISVDTRSGKTCGIMLMLVSCQSQGPCRKGHNKIGENRTSNRGHRIGSDKIRKGRDRSVRVSSVRLELVSGCVGSSQVGLGFVCGSVQGFVSGFYLRLCPEFRSEGLVRHFIWIFFCPRFCLVFCSGFCLRFCLGYIIDDSDDTTIGIRGGVLGFLPSTPIEFTKAGCRRQKEEGGIEVGRGGRGGRRERGGLKTGKLLVNDVVVVVIVVVPTGFQPSLSTRKPSPGCFGLVSFSQEIQSSNKCSRTSLYFNVRRGHRYTSTVVVDEDLLCQNQAVALSLHLPSAGMFEISRFEPRPN
ncbi:hypothetical protein V1477_018761 [Vespula maculifrons]|uniref:Uncharacterized protein n=1 Tax=Vespula maculifrons TaxID=7453 RepID=A0ABD2AY55_VESMC